MRSLRKAAKGAPCFLWLPGCSPGPDNEQTVLCHRKGAGMALKTDDLDAVLGCTGNCHRLLDGPESALMLLTGETYDEIFEAAKRRTHRYWREKGLIQ